MIEIKPLPDFIQARWCVIRNGRLIAQFVKETQAWAYMRQLEKAERKTA